MRIIKKNLGLILLLSIITCILMSLIGYGIYETYLFGYSDGIISHKNMNSGKYNTTYMFILQKEVNGKILKRHIDVTEIEYLTYDIGDYYSR